MSKAAPPLLGFNNNVRHRGRVFHIQTEDSGVKFPRIVTHLFADGGRIVKTTRTDYSEHVDKTDMATVVRGMMKEQHKAMFAALRAGELDKLLENVCGPLEAAAAKADNATVVDPTAQHDLASARVVVGRPSSASQSQMKATVASAAPGVGAEGPSSKPLELDVASLAPNPPNESRTPPSARPPRKSNPAPRKSRPPLPPRAAAGAPAPVAVAAGDVGAGALGRPQTRLAAAPPTSSRSIFGDGAISEKSLDEVILSYLAEDLEESK